MPAIARSRGHCKRKHIKVTEAVPQLEQKQGNNIPPVRKLRPYRVRIAVRRDRRVWTLTPRVKAVHRREFNVLRPIKAVGGFKPDLWRCRGRISACFWWASRLLGLVSPNWRLLLVASPWARLQHPRSREIGSGKRSSLKQ